MALGINWEGSVFQNKWTEEQEAALKKCVDEKRSAGETSVIMQMTRNSLIGKASRMGLRFTSKAQPKRLGHDYPRQRRTWGIPKMPLRTPPTPPKQPDKPDEFLGLTIWQLKDGPITQCRFMDDGLYCGQPTTGKSWCAHHHRIVYYPVTEGKRHAL